MMASVVTMVDSLVIMAALVEALVGLVDTAAVLVVMDQGGGHQGKDDVVVVISENITFYVKWYIYIEDKYRDIS